MYRKNPLKARLAAGGKCLGAWHSLPCPAVAEILAMAGYDFIIIDYEHGPGNLDLLCNQLRALKGTPVTSILRVPSHDPHFIKTALDQGIEGIMAPNVKTAAEAEALVAACLYPPAGIRGSAYPIARGAGYGVHAAEYLETVNDNLVIMCQIESKTAVDNIEDIIAVPGIDVLFMGLNDLAGSIGKLHALDDPEVTALVQHFEAAVKADGGKHLGSIPQPGRDCNALFADGYAVAAGATDVLTLLNACRSEVNAHREIHG